MAGLDILVSGRHWHQGTLLELWVRQFLQISSAEFSYLFFFAVENEKLSAVEIRLFHSCAFLQETV